MTSATRSFSPACTAFLDGHCIAHGPMPDVAVRLHERSMHRDLNGLLVFDDATGQVLELDLRGNASQVRSRYLASADTPPRTAAAPPATRPRGRPRMGVVAREVTLLPEHWNWLAGQPGGASVVLRRLVHEARKAGEPQDLERRARERAYQAMRVLAGDRPGFEAASRALFAGDRAALQASVAAWPADMRDYLDRLLQADDPGSPPSLPPSPSPES